jgi:hypothetical protein
VVIMVWPAVAALGFLLLTALVIALGVSSTARYDFDRNRVQDAPEPAFEGAAAAATSRCAGWADGAARAPGSGRLSAPPEPRAAGGPAAHPAGRRLGEGQAATGWWLVDQPDGDGAIARVLAGPFTDRLDAEWAALAKAPFGPVTTAVVHGKRSVTGALLLTPAPQEGPWMLELGQQLTRLGEEWFELASDTDPLTTLVVEVAEALIEAGLPLHDGDGAFGGVCLTPCTDSAGILVSWHGHERMTLQQLHGAEVDAAVRRTMSAAVADVLLHRGFDVRPLGGGCGHLVTSACR